MDEKSISAALRKLAKTSNRPKAAIFRDLFPDIELALNARVPRKLVLEELNRVSQLNLSEGTFRIYIERTRKLLKLGQSLQSAPVESSHSFPQVNSSSENSKPSASMGKTQASKGPARNKSITKSTEESSMKQPPGAINFRAMRNAPVDFLELMAAGKAAEKTKK